MKLIIKGTWLNDSTLLFLALLASLFITPSISTAQVVFDGDYPVGATIDQVSYTIKEASTFTCVSPTQNLSLIERMLASVGMVTKTKLLAQANPCANYTGSGGMVFWGIDSSYALTPQISLRTREFTGFVGIEKYSRTNKNTTAPRYGSKTCIINHTYDKYLDHSKSGGKITDSCNTLTPSHNVDYPPEIPVNPAKGSYSATWKNSNTIHNFTVNEESRSQLTFNGAPGKAYNIIVSATAQQLILNKKTNMFEYKDIPCASITVAGQKLNSSCQTTLKATGIVATFDVTPKASVPYYFYSVSNNSPQEIQPIP